MARCHCWSRCDRAQQACCAEQDAVQACRASAASGQLRARLLLSFPQCIPQCRGSSACKPGSLAPAETSATTPLPGPSRRPGGQTARCPLWRGLTCEATRARAGSAARHGEGSLQGATLWLPAKTSNRSVAPVLPPPSFANPRPCFRRLQVCGPGNCTNGTLPACPMVPGAVTSSPPLSAAAPPPPPPSISRPAAMLGTAAQALLAGLGECLAGCKPSANLCVLHARSSCSGLYDSMLR